MISFLRSKCYFEFNWQVRFAWMVEFFYHQSVGRGFESCLRWWKQYWSSWVFSYRLLQCKLICSLSLQGSASVKCVWKQYITFQLTREWAKDGGVLFKSLNLALRILLVALTRIPELYQDHSAICRTHFSCSISWTKDVCSYTWWTRDYFRIF